jgi:hypothetical protein
MSLIYASLKTISDMGIFNKIGLKKYASQQQTNCCMQAISALICAMRMKQKIVI